MRIAVLAVQGAFIEHEHILQALKNHDIQDAKSAVRGHIDNQQLTVSKNIKEKQER